MKTLKIIIIGFFFTWLTGCTFTFKGTDLEATGEMAQNIELKSVSLLDDDSKHKINLPW